MESAIKDLVVPGGHGIYYLVVWYRPGFSAEIGASILASGLDGEVVTKGGRIRKGSFANPIFSVLGNGPRVRNASNMVL